MTLKTWEFRGIGLAHTLPSSIDNERHYNLDVADCQRAISLWMAALMSDCPSFKPDKHHLGERGNHGYAKDQLEEWTAKLDELKEVR